MNLKDYIRGKRHGQAANKLEREALHDAFLQDAIDGFDAVQGAHSETVKRLEKFIPTEKKRTSRRIWFVAAAAVLIVLIGIPFLLRKNNVKQDVSVTVAEPKSTPPTSLSEDTTQNISAKESASNSKKVSSNDSIIVEPVKEIAIANSIITKEDTESHNAEEMKPTAPKEEARTNSHPFESMRKSTLQKKQLTAKTNKNVVTGRIIDEYGNPIVGAMVSIKHDKQGVVTNTDGTFELPVTTKTNDMLVASYVGMKKVERPIKEHMGNIIMKEDDELLSEVVTIGSGKQNGSSTVGTEVDKETVSSFGEKEFTDYFKKHYDKNVCSDTAIVFVVQFYINADGQPTNIKIKENNCPALSTDIKRLLIGSPKWSQTKRQVTLRVEL